MRTCPAFEPVELYAPEGAQIDLYRRGDSDEYVIRAIHFASGRIRQYVIPGEQLRYGQVERVTDRAISDVWIWLAQQQREIDHPIGWDADGAPVWEGMCAN